MAVSSTEHRLSSSALIDGNQAVQLQLVPQRPRPTMTLQLRTKARLFDLHCSVGLTDWDMDKELKLAITTDQMYHGQALLFPSGDLQHVILNHGCVVCPR